MSNRDEDVHVPRGWVDRRQLLAMSAGAALAGADCWGVSAQSGAKAAGSVGDLQGDASVETDGRRRMLLLKESVFVGETVSTGPNARLLLMLGQRTTLRLGADAKLKIERYLLDAGGELELTNGALQFERKGKPAATELKIRSAYGLITVRGTRFFAGPSKGVFGVLVGTGRVEVSSGGKTVSVGPQQGTNIAKPGDRPTVPAPWGEARIREALASVRR